VIVLLRKRNDLDRCLQRVFLTNQKDLGGRRRKGIQPCFRCEEGVNCSWIEMVEKKTFFNFLYSTLFSLKLKLKEQLGIRALVGIPRVLSWSQSHELGIVEGNQTVCCHQILKFCTPIWLPIEDSGL
jgi:hypothetical protein